MSNGKWLVLALAGGVAVVGLLLAAASPDGGAAYVMGLALFVAGVAYAFVFIKRHFDRNEQGRH
jgi:hypothetical protein